MKSIQSVKTICNSWNFGVTGFLGGVYMKAIAQIPFEMCCTHNF